MNKKLLITLMIIAAMSTNAAVNEYSKNGNFRIVQANEHIVSIETGAYNDLLRVVDEQNRRNGIESNYVNKSTNRISQIHDLVDLIPVATYTDETDSYKVEFSGLVEAARDSKLYSELSQGYNLAPKIIEKGVDAIDKSILEKTANIRSGNVKRLYFGNGNTAKDIKFISKDTFDDTKESLKNNIRYSLEGKYKSINTNDMNQLGITMDEYYSKIQGKNKNEIVAFLKEKMLEKGINVFEKNGELFTKDENNTEWRVLWSLEPVSLHQVAETDENKRFKDSIFTRIYTYDSTTSPTDAAGKILYSKDNSIFLEDKYDYNEDAISIKGANWYDSSKPLSQLIKEAKEKAENGTGSENAIDTYFKDKKSLENGSLTQADFNNKWVIPFQAGGQYEQDLTNMKREMGETIARKEIVDKERKEATALYTNAQEDAEFPKDFSRWTWNSMNSAEKTAYLATKTERARELITIYITNYELSSAKYSESIALDDDIQNNILGKYGFKKVFGIANSDRWLDRLIPNTSIIRNLLGKNVEFRGKGRVEGIIDLGEGDNQLTIREQFTGRYGTNIILGPYAKLKNIKIVNVAGQVGSDSGVSLSGRSSLSLDIDPNIKNSEGHLVQHALRDSDKNIIFRKAGSELNINDRNNYYIELMISKIAEDSTINMGRKINYTYDDIKNGTLDMKMSFISDSIVHNLSYNGKEGKDGNSLLEVKIKDRIKRLDTDENDVYRSIKNAGKINILHPTITTTNKKTKFSVLDDEKETVKTKDLAIYLKTKAAEDIIKDLSQFYLRDSEKEELATVIATIKEGKAIKDNIAKEKDLKEKLTAVRELEKLDTYNNMELPTLYKELMSFDIDTLKETGFSSSWSSTPEEMAAAEAVRNKATTAIKGIVAKINLADLDILRTQFPSLELDSLYTQATTLLNKIVEDGWDFRSFLNSLELLKTTINKQNLYNTENLAKELSEINDNLAKDLESPGQDKANEYYFLKNKLYYTLREEEALRELKNILAQLKDRNIYSKLNKIAKNEISTYTNIPFDINYSLSENKIYTRGGFISNRTVQDNFKGNIYTAYGIYEKTNKNNNKYGLMIGGANTNHTEVYQRTLNTVATESTIKGVSAYIGGYYNKELLPNMNLISGLGIQHGRYKIDRDMKNTYQSLKATGKTSVNAATTYTGMILNYPIHEDVSVQLKGLLSYSFVQQNKVSESGDLALDIKSKNYNYIDGELGVNFTKVLYGDNMKSSMSAGIYGIAGLYGYRNADLDAKISGSTSSFNIKGDSIKKDAVKIFIDYNVQSDEGYNYGLEGTYISNSKENSVKIGVKAGYVF